MALQLFKIADVTVASPQASIDFQNIPSGYTDLAILISAKTSDTTSGENGTDLNLRFNNDSGSNYSSRILYRTASLGSASNSGTSIYWGGQANNSASTMTNTFSNIAVYIPNYTGSNNKSVSLDSVAEANASTYGLLLSAGLWTSSSAINRITFTIVNGSLVQYTTATLYGVL
jgi:hypothetical protein